MKTRIDIQAPQSCHTGRALLKINMSHPLGVMFDSCRGSIYHGGTHGMSFEVDHKDALAWLDLFIEEFPDTRISMMAIKKEIMRKVRDNVTNKLGEVYVKAERLEVRQSCQFGSEMVKIFKTEQEWERHGGWRSVFKEDADIGC